VNPHREGKDGIEQYKREENILRPIKIKKEGKET